MTHLDEPAKGAGGAGVPHDVAPFAAWLGLRTERAEAGRAVMHLATRHDLLNRRDNVHGGVLASLLDSAMARASRTITGVKELSGTTDLHVHFMRAARGDLRVTAWVEHASGTLAFCRGEVHDAAGELVASGSACMRLRR